MDMLTMDLLTVALDAMALLTMASMINNSSRYLLPGRKLPMAVLTTALHTTTTRPGTACYPLPMALLTMAGTASS